jgi:hypothetical protein
VTATPAAKAQRTQRETGKQMEKGRIFLRLKVRRVDLSRSVLCAIFFAPFAPLRQMFL